jgi:hypothetical protein
MVSAASGCTPFPGAAFCDRPFSVPVKEPGAPAAVIVDYNVEKVLDGHGLRFDDLPVL